MDGNVRNGPVPIYQADPQWSDQVRLMRQQLTAVCGKCKNRRVRVHTVDGHIYEGTVIGHEGSMLYLAAKDQRFFAPYAAGYILPLVLFDLLAITLLI
jgi:hypothetical protein